MQPSWLARNAVPCGVPMCGSALQLPRPVFQPAVLRFILISAGIAILAPSRCACPSGGCGADRARAGRRFALAFEQFLEHHRIVLFFVFRGIEECQLPVLLAKCMQLLQRLLCRFGREFFEVFFAKLAPLRPMSMEPFTQFIRGSKVFQPGIE